MESRSRSTADLAHLLVTTPKTIATYAGLGVVESIARWRSWSTTEFAKRYSPTAERLKGLALLARRRFMQIIAESELKALMAEWRREGPVA